MTNRRSTTSQTTAQLLAFALSAGVLGTIGCGRLQFEQVDPVTTMDAGDAMIGEAGSEAGMLDGALDAANDGARTDGGDDGGQPIVHVIPNETLLSTGALHSCAGLFGRLYCWGDNTHGQLGDGTTQDRSAPVQLGSIRNVADVQLGEEHSCAMTAVGEVYCWGRNDQGQLGDGTTIDRVRPTLVVGLERGVRALWVGPFHACVRAEDNRLLCWGRNNHGQVGDGTRTMRVSPVAMTNTQNISALALGADMTCAVMTNQTMTCRGHNLNGQLGTGAAADTDALSPVSVVGVSGVQSATAGHNHVCVTLGDGKAFCWGGNQRFQCGNDSVSANEPQAVQVALLAATRAADASESTSCAVDETGVAKCWGANVAGSTTERRVPTIVQDVTGVREVRAGRTHQCMRVASNYIHCAGDNSEGQLGNGTRQPSATSVQVLGLPAPVSGPAPECGDRFINNPETCDDGIETARCNADCTLSRCGDGVINASAGETCETGGDLDAGGCLGDCTLP